MNSRDILNLCLGNLLRRKTRTVLAVIGVIVGVCAIVIMVSIGVGLDRSYSQQIEEYGNLHMVEVNNWGSGDTKLNDATITKMAKIDGVTAITPVATEYLTIGIGKMRTTTTVYGMDPEYIALMNYDLDHGRSFTAADADSNVLLFGKSVACWFYDARKQETYNWDNTEPTAEVVTKDIILCYDWNWGTKDEGTGEIKYEEFEAEGVGLLAGENDENAYRVFMPIKALQKIINANDKAEGQKIASDVTYDTAYIYVENLDDIESICATIKEDYGFYTYSLTDMLNEVQQTARTIELVLGGIGAVSLLVAAIGIANTMVMSVYERTKEIGVMKVIGASLNDIQNIFLTEAALIGFGGGIIGVVLSYLLSWAANTFLSGLSESITGGAGSLSYIPLWLSLGALAFATFVGIISGWAPARRAMKLSALEGLKND